MNTETIASLRVVTQAGAPARAGVLAAVLAMAVYACQPAPPPAADGPPSDADKAQISERVQAYVQKTANLPPNVTVKVIDIALADAPGLLTANLEASNGTDKQKVPLVLSRNGRYMIEGQLTDLTADPYKAALDKIALKDVPVRGNPNAKIIIVEYSDFQCPYCGRAYKTLEDEVLKTYGDKVRFVFKNYPLSSIHPWADSGALAAACARRQSPEAFWKMYDFLFQNQETITADNLKEKADGFVKGANLDVAAFDACFDNKTALDAVKADQEEANALGVQSTPTFFINGRKMEGALPFDSFKTVLDEMLSKGA